MMRGLKRKLYDVLGVEPDASPEDIKRAFRQQAKKTHPDSGGNVEDFQAIQRAYAVLGSPEKRARYDADGNENPAADNVHVAVLGNIQGTISQIIEKLIAQNQPVSQHDVVKLAHSAFEDQVLNIKRQVKDTKRNIAVLEDVQKRFHVKQGQNVLAEMMTAKIRSGKDALEKMNEALALLGKCIETLHDYSFDVETPSPQSGTYWDVVSSGFNTSALGTQQQQPPVGRQ